MKFKILSNPSADWKKYKRRKAPKTQKSIPDNDLEMQKGASYDQATKAEEEYFYAGRPYGAGDPHV